jgi:trans-2,3-dihydro-3-hydroxyanthranilate isomerase
VHDADGIDDATMLAFARETRLPETTFVQRATEDGADYRNRIFTVAGEVPFAGHPSLGTAVAVAAARNETDAGYVQQTGAGLQPIDVRRDGGSWVASMLQEPPVFREEVNPSHVMAAVGLVTGDAHPELPPQVVTTGLPTLVVLLTEEDAVVRAAPDFELVVPLLDRCEAVSLYLAWHDGADRAHARMFTSMVVGGEDPATGSAAGPLCAYLAGRGRADRLVISQGAEIGRASTISAQMEDGRPRVGGTVVPLIEGRVAL